jgi:hypothetical protein
LNPEDFKGDWTNPGLTFAIFNKIMKDLDQHIISKKSISDNPPDSVDMLNKFLIFSPLGDFALNKQLVKQVNKQIGKLLNKQPG